MKKFLVFAMLLAAPGFAMAQKTGEHRAPLSPQERAEKHTARLDAIVSLTPDQRQKISAENLRTAQAMQPHMDNVRKEKQAMRAIGKQRREAYASILTPEQMQRLKAMHKSNHANRNGRGAGHMKPGRAAEMRMDAPNK